MMMAQVQMLPAASELASLGAAGLMGALWIWERRLSRSREAQLTEAHQRLVQTNGQVQVLADLVARNTAALTSLQETQHQLVHLLGRWRNGGGGSDLDLALR